MKYKEILNELAPCGLSCKKCICYQNGNIKRLSLDLKEALGAFHKMAKKFSNFNPALGKYPEFQEVLDFFTQASCAGCRNGGCKYPNCGVHPCHLEKMLIFAFNVMNFLAIKVILILH